MNMHDYATQEFKKLAKQIEQDNRKLEALRMVIKEYATDQYPGDDKMNAMIVDCARERGGQAKLQEIAEYIDARHITIPRHKLSWLLHQHPQVEYDKEQKIWKIIQNLPNTNKV